MTDDLLYSDPALARFYDAENDDRPDLAAVAALAKGAGSVLDIGCGTGLLARLLPAGCRYTGADPAAAMLEIARGMPVAADATWVQATVEELNLNQRFDLVVMSGHAFQVFLTPLARRLALASVARHLAPEGRFVFDSRNPACREWEEWTPETSWRAFDQPGIGRIKAWNDVAHDAASGVVTYRTFYELPDGKISEAASQIAFPDRAEIEAALADAGLAAREWWGDWQGSASGSSLPEIIALGGLRK